MDEATYQRWWPLHIKSAKGETLTPDEQAFYEAGLCRLHREERLHDNPALLEDIEASIARLEHENAELAVRRQNLETQLSQLQKRNAARPADLAVQDK